MFGWQQGRLCYYILLVREIAAKLDCMDEEREIELTSEKPLIAISRCLLGEPVRFNGEARPVDWIVQILSQHCDFLPICPELEAGFGVPRPPMRLQQQDGAVSVVLVDDPAAERTEQLQVACERLLSEINPVHGVILKARSPSCGVEDTPLFNKSGEQFATGPGLFTRMCKAAKPGLPVIDDQGLQSEAGRVSFLIQVFRYCCRRRTR